jgi:UDP-glucose 4-epimerase
MGLIPTLIYDSLRYRPSRIVGNLDTCRDYIYCGDIGNFVSSVIEGQPATDNNFLLASGKPTTIQELVRLIENETGHPLYLSFDPTAPNSETNSYQKSGIPEELNITELHLGIKMVKYKIFKYFTVNV